MDIDADALASAHRNCQLNNLHVQLYHANVDSVEDTAKDTAQDSVHDSMQGTSQQDTIHEATQDTSQDSALVFPPASAALRGRQFDLVVANILAPVLIQLAVDLAQLTAPGGSIALSGVLDFQAEAVMSAYKEYFDQVCVADQRDGWVLITGVKPQGNLAVISNEGGT